MVLLRAVSPFNGTCPHETEEGSRRYSFSGTISWLNGKEIGKQKVCFTFVPIDSVPNASMQDAFLAVEYMQNYCEKNLSNGQVVNLDMLKRMKLLNGNLPRGDFLNVYTSEIYGILMGPVNEEDAKVYQAYQVKITNGEKSFNSEICATNLNSARTDCHLLSNLSADGHNVMELINSTEPLWRTITLSSNSQRVYKQTESLEAGGTVKNNSGFLCVHEPYRDCEYLEQRTNCYYDSISGSCTRLVLYFIEVYPDEKEGRRCPESHTTACECTEAIDYNTLMEKYECLNDGEKVFRKDGSIYCKCGFLYAGERCDESKFNYSIKAYSIEEVYGSNCCM
ncbi:hypothetical protein TTRE_0000035801 [Trichuris trichiura]|uniref:EGF-like domain-containing protein n=1 Tax=Trichuris trichiura TaxID=36087 RepID=A0A077YWJ5_TRITR|nr:hypothetical protein TTRE_0000035801 [Trichuris trichiura]